MKKLSTLILILALTLSCMPMSIFAESVSEEIQASYENKDTQEQVEEQTKEAEQAPISAPLVTSGGNVAMIVGGDEYPTVQAAINAATNGQTVQMLANSTENVEFESAKTITLDLNGKVLCGDSTASVIKINNKQGSKLTITDSKPNVEHKFKPASGDRKAGLWTWDETNGTEVVKGGIITGGNAGGSSGGGLYVNASSTGALVLEGGSIVGCKAGSGGGVDTYSPFTMTGGAIIGCSGSGVLLRTGSNLNMTGGTISNCSGSTNGGGILTSKEITISMSGNASITECEAPNGSGGGVYIDNSKTQFTMSGNASISKCSASNSTSDSYGGGGVWIKGTMTLKDNASISECEASNGGGVLARSGFFNMEGGSISQCKIVKNGSNAYKGGGVFVSESSTQFTMTGGVIEKCEASVSGSYGTAGGGVYVKNGGSFIFSGGTISQCNTNNNGGGVYNEGVVTVGGTAKVTGNTKGTGASALANNLYLVSGKTVTVSTDTTLAQGADIGVTLASGTGDVTGTTDAANVKFFTSDDAAYTVTFGSNVVKLVSIGTNKAKIVETGVLYTTVQAAIIAATSGQTVQMLADSKERMLFNKDNVSSAKAVNLDLNGYALIGPNSSTSGNDNNVIMHNTAKLELTIKDSNSNRAHYYTYSSSSAWTLYDTASEDAKKNAITLDKLDSKTQDGTLVRIPGGVITGGNRNNNGGGIYVASNAKLTLNGINVIGNAVTGEKNGGGIYGNEGATITIIDCNIAGNTTACDGGALYVYGTTKATNTQFVGNSSARHGGAVYVAKGKTFDADKCTFSNNKATGINGYGGALYINSETGNVSKATITDCTFENNNAFVSGGGIYNNYGTATITGGSYNNNSAQYAGVIFNDTGTATITGGSYKNNSVTRAGGVIYNDGATLKINGATFESNTASSDENDTTGGFLHSRSANLSDASVTITGATIRSNQAKAGGAIYNARFNSESEHTTTITITNSEITGNTANANGGGVYNKCTVIVSGTTKITGNKKGTGDTATTSNVYLESGKTITVGTGGLDADKAAIGVTLASGTGDVTVASNADYAKYFFSDVDTYVAVNEGTGSNQVVKLVNSVAKIVETGKSYGTVQAAINAATNGQTVQMLADSSEDVTVGENQKITIDLNGHILSSAGTASVVTNNGTLTVKDSNKTVTHYYKVNSDGLWVLDTDATSGTAYEDLKERPKENDVIAIKGGAITGGKNGSIIDGGNYGGEGNAAVGGAIYSAGDITVDGVVICGNTIDNETGGRYMGMGIFCKGEKCIIKNSIICGNSCLATEKKAAGGAVFSASTVSVESSSLSFNTVDFFGGAIMIRGKQSETGYYASLTLTNCTLFGNKAGNGGAVELYGDENDATKTVFTFENCTIDKNIAVSDGGAIDSKYGTLKIIGGSVSNNICTGNGEYDCSGGAIMDQSETYLKDVIISGNTAVRGGAIRLLNNNLTAENTKFTKNKATGDKDNSCGGAIYAGNGSDTDTQYVKLTNCEISENSADANGGGIHLNCTSPSNTPEGVVEAEITGGKITGNTSGNKGGGLYIDSCFASTKNAIGKATLVNVEVSNNKAVNGGGVGMNTSAQLLMNGCTVKGNSATETDIANTGLGGGIYKPGEYQTTADVIEEKVVLLNTEITGNTASVNGGGVYFKVTEYENTCFVKGTKISMADGTTKNVENIVEGDVIKTFDHETGKISSAKVYLAWQKENASELASFKLNFEGGNSVQCVGGHDFLEKASRKYQKLTAENAESYIGKSFYGEDGKWHKLLSVSIEETPDYLYCIYSAKHQNSFANGMLSVPDDVDYLLNIYELDKNLKADEAQLAVDIKEYGLTSYEYAKEHSDSITREWYEAAGTKYLFIAIGKGLLTEDQAINLYNATIESSSKTKSSPLEGLKTRLQPVLSFFAPVEVYADEAPTLDDYDAGYITVGSGTTITNNKVGDKQNNAYIARSRKKVDKDGNFETVESLFKVIPDSKNINIGVTTSVTPTAEAAVPVTTAENSKDYSDFFTSDNADYTAYNRGLGETQQIAIGKEVAVIVETNVAYGSVQAAIDAATNGQTVKMLADSTENVQVGTSTDRSKNITLDLNGKTLKSTGTVEGIRNNAICNYATLTIADSSKDGSGKITGGTGSAKGKGSYGGGVYNSEGTLTMTGGTITGNSAGFGGGVANIKGTFTMTGGSITGNTSTGTGGGGVVNLDGAIFIMTGGSITENSANNDGGGVYNAATMKISGKAKVTNNTKGTGETATANNVYLPSGKTITVSAALTSGAAIGVTTADTPVAGTPVNITGSNGTNDYSAYFSSDNTAYDIVENGTKTELVVASGIPVAKITTGGVTKKFGTVQKAIDFADNGDTVVMIANSTEQVTVASDDVVTLDLNGFVLKGTGSGCVISNAGKLTIKDSKHSDTTVKHYFTVGSNDVWNWNSDASETDYYVTGGVITGGKNSTEGETNYGNGVANKGTLEIEGINIIGNSTGNWGGGLLSEGGSVTVKNSLIAHNYSIWCAGVGIKNSGTYSFENTEISNNKSQYEGGGFYIESATATLTKCTVKGNTSTKSHGGGLYLKKGASVTMNEGTITKNSAAASNGAAYLTGNACSLTLNGVSVTDNTANNTAGGIKIESGHTLSVGGATEISGNTYGTTKVSSNVYLASGKTITVSSALTKGASIGVTLGTADGTGAVTGENSADYHEYFVPDNEDLVSYNDKTSDINQVVKLKKAEPTAIIYSDGYMVFQNGDTADAAHGTVLGTYTGFTTGVYSFTSTSDLSTMPPWYQDGNYKNVTYVLFKDTIKPENTACWFRDMTKLEDGDFDKLDASAVEDMNMMFQGCTVFNPKKAFPAGFGSKAKYMQSMFRACTTLSLEVAFPTNFGSEAKNMEGMFYNCQGIISLTNLPDGFGAKVTNVKSLFAFCKNMTTLDISMMNTGAVTEGSFCFNATPSLQTIILGENWKFEGSGTSRLSDFNFYKAKSDDTYGGHWSCITGTNKGTEYDANKVPNGAGKYTWSKKTTVTPATDEFTYDGSGHRNTLTVKGPTKYVDTYDSSSKPVNAGTYNEKYTVTPDKDDFPEYETVTGTVTTKINKATPTASDFTFEEPEGLTYDGTKKEASVTTDKTGMGDITVEYYDGSTKLSEAPKNAGDYTVKISVAEGDNYTDASNLTAGSWTFTIAKATPTASDFTFAEPTKLTYDGDKKEASVTSSKTGMGTITVEYYDSATKLSEAPKNAGDYTVKISVAEGDNYTSASDLTATSWKFTIAKATPTASDFTFTAPEELTYDGNKKEASVTTSLTGMGTITVEYYDGATKLSEAPKKVGTYTVKISVAEGTNYNEVSDLNATGWKFTITKAQLTIADTTVSDKSYDGNKVATVTKGTVSGIVKGDDVTVTASGEFASADKGTHEVTVTYSLSGDDAGNYIAPEQEKISAKITAAELVLSDITATAITYGQTLANSTVSGTAKFGETEVTGTWSWKTTSTTKPAVSDSEKTEYNVTFTPTSDNYQTTDGKVTLKVNKKQLEIAGTTVSGKTYDGTTDATATAGTLSNLEENDKVTVSVTSAQFADKNAGEDKTVTVKYEISGDDAANYLAPVDDDSFTATISKKQLSISTKDGEKTTVEGKTYDGTKDAKSKVTLGTVVGIVTNDKAEVKVYSAEFADKKAGKNKTVTIVYQVTGEDADNYIKPDTDSSLKADITAKQLTISDTKLDGKTFDNTTTASATAGTLGGVVTDDIALVTVSVKSAVFADKNAGKNKKATVEYEISGTAADNYIAPVEDTLYADITAKDIKVKADDKSTYVGSDLVKLTYTHDDLYGTDSFTGALATAADKSKAGSYDITQGDLSAGSNYNIVYTKGTYTVSDKEAQTLKFEGVTGGSVTKTYGDKAFTEAVSGAKTTVTYSSSDKSVATVDASTGEVTILKAGSTTITATAEETYKYEEASAQYTLTVNKKQLTISGTSADDKTYDRTTKATAHLGTVSGICKSDDVEVKIDSATFDSKDVSKTRTVKVVYTLDGTARDNYIKPVDDTIKNVTIKAKQLTIAGTTVEGKTYDGTTSATAAVGTLDNVILGDTVKVSISSATYANKKAEDNKDVTVKYAISGTDASNYLAPVDGTLKANIKARKLTIAAPTVSDKVYDSTAAATATIGELENAVKGDDISASIVESYFNNANVGINKKVTVTYTIKGSDKANYVTPDDSIVYASITAKAVTVTAEDKKMNLGDELPELTAVVEGLLGEDTIEYSFAELEPETQGVYSINPIGEAEQGNYAVTFKQGNLTVTDTKSKASASSEDVTKVLEKYRAKEEYSTKSLDVEVRTSEKVSEEDKALIAAKTNKKLQIMDTGLFLIITDAEGTTEENIGSDNDTLIAVSYKFDFTKKKNFQIFRVHEEEVEELTTIANDDGEYVTYNQEAGTITVYAKKYSAYAVAYDEVKDGVNTGDANNIALYLTLLMISLLSLGGYSIRKKTN